MKKSASEQPLQDWTDDRLVPMPTEKAVVMLARCLALCAPAGMTADDRKEWLAAAVDEVGGYPASVLHDAARGARRTCTHPSQVVPAIVVLADAAREQLVQAIWREREGGMRAKMLPPARPCEIKRPMPQHVIDHLIEPLRKLGVRAGWLVQDKGGRLVWAPEERDNAGNSRCD